MNKLNLKLSPKLQTKSIMAHIYPDGTVTRHYINHGVQQFGELVQEIDPSKIKIRFADGTEYSNFISGPISIHMTPEEFSKLMKNE